MRDAGRLKYNLPLSVNTLAALCTLSLVPGLRFVATVSGPPKVFAVPGLKTTDGVTFKDDLVKVK